MAQSKACAARDSGATFFRNPFCRFRAPGYARSRIRRVNPRRSETDICDFRRPSGTAELGFWIPSGSGRHPTDTENSAAHLSDGYLELITPYDTSLPDGRAIAGRLKKGEGAVAAGLQVASAEQTTRNLSAAGLKINGPTLGTIVRTGEKEPPPPYWWLVTFGGPVFVDQLASRPLFLIQYAPRSARPPTRPANPNSASSLSALLVAVSDLQGSAAGYGNLGKAGDQEIPLPEFGPVGKEIVLERGSIPAAARDRSFRSHGSEAQGAGRRNSGGEAGRYGPGSGSQTDRREERLEGQAISVGLSRKRSGGLARTSGCASL